MAFGFALAQHWKWDADILPFEALRYPEFIASTSHPCPGVWAILSKAGREFALAFAWGPTMTGSGCRRELQHGNLPIRVAPKRSVSWVRPLGTHAFPTSGHLRLARQLTKDGVAPCQYQILGRLHPGHAAQLQHPRSTWDAHRRANASWAVVYSYIHSPGLSIDSGRFCCPIVLNLPRQFPSRVPVFAACQFVSRAHRVKGWSDLAS